MAKKAKKHVLDTGYVKRAGVRKHTSRQDLAEILKERPSLSIRRYDNPNIITSKLAFQYESAEEPKLQLLREKYDLDGVVQDGRTEFEKMVLLRKWVNSRWTHASPKSKDHARLNALQLLERAERGEDFFCHHYSVAFIQCCVALGWQARFVALKTSGPFGHSVAEVWSNQYRKWVLMDTDYDVHYLYRQVPLSALDLHRTWLSTPERVSAVEAVKGPRNLLQWNLLDFYFHFRIGMGNNYFQTDARRWIISGNPWVEWHGDVMPAQIWDHDTDLLTNREEDLYCTLNLTHITLSLTRDAGSVNVHLNTFTPCFDAFDITVDRVNRQQKEPRFTWRLHRGINTLKVKATNRYGSAAVPSTIALQHR